MNINKLDLFHDSYFTKKEIDDLIYKISISFVEKYFIKEQISNQQYEKDVFKIIQKLIIEEVTVTFEKSQEFYKELSVYIFKKYFKTIFKYISESLINEISLSNTNVIDFLKYYSVDTIVVDEIKYQVPQIKTDDGPRWNVVSMINVIKTYLNAKERLSFTEKKLKDLNTELNACLVNSLSPFEYNSQIEEEFNKLEELIKKNTLNIDIVRDCITLEKNGDNLIKFNQELKDFKDERLKLREEKTRLLKSKIKQQELDKYEKLYLEVEALTRDRKPYNKILEQNQDKYLSIQNSLIKALISKRQAI